MAIKTTLAAFAALACLSGAASAQSTEGNMKNPGSVKSNSEKAMPSKDMPATTGGSGTGTGMAPASGAAGATEGNMNNPGSVKSDSEKMGR